MFSMLMTLMGFSQNAILVSEQSYFENRSSQYQDWLEVSGLDQVLKVKTIRTTENNLTLFLEFHTEDPNSCWVQWTELQDHFAATSNISLQEQLFYKLVALMNVPQEYCTIKLYDTYNLEKKPCFFANISLAQGRINLQTDRCRKRKVSFNGNLKQLNLKQPVSRNFHSNLSGEVLADLFYHYAKNKFQNHYCCANDMKADIKILELTPTMIRLQVDDVKKQILAKSRGTEFCEKNDCESIIKEQLFFTVTFDKHSSGITMNVDVEASFGSASANPSDKTAYTYMDETFNEILRDYATEVTNDVHQIIVNLGK